MKNRISVSSILIGFFVGSLSIFLLRGCGSFNTVDEQDYQRKVQEVEQLKEEIRDADKLIIELMINYAALKNENEELKQTVNDGLSEINQLVEMNLSLEEKIKYLEALTISSKAKILYLSREVEKLEEENNALEGVVKKSQEDKKNYKKIPLLDYPITGKNVDVFQLDSLASITLKIAIERVGFHLCENGYQNHKYFAIGNEEHLKGIAIATLPESLNSDGARSDFIHSENWYLMLAAKTYEFSMSGFGYPGPKRALLFVFLMEEVDSESVAIKTYDMTTMRAGVENMFLEEELQEIIIKAELNLISFGGTEAIGIGKDLEDLLTLLRN